jgi:hypothetical protein
LKPFVGSPVSAICEDLRRNDQVPGLEVWSESASDPEADQAIRALDRAFNESGGTFPVSGADHDGKASRARDPRFCGQPRSAKHRRKSVHAQSPFPTILRQVFQNGPGLSLGSTRDFIGRWLT